MNREGYVFLVLIASLVVVVGLYVVYASDFDLADLLCWLEWGTCEQ